MNFVKGMLLNEYRKKDGAQNGERNIQLILPFSRDSKLSKTKKSRI